MAQSTTEIYTILVQTTGTAEIRALTKELDQSNRAMQKVQQQTKGAATATDNLTKAQKQAALQWQNTGYQVQDFLVQVSAGTGIMRAAGQQLPQLLSGFGLWGVALGTAAAALGGLLPLLMDTKNPAEAAADAITDLVTATDALYASTEAANRPLSDFRSEFGAFAEMAQGLSQIQLEIDSAQAEMALTRAQASLDKLKLSGEDTLNSWKSLTGQMASLQFDIINKDASDWSGDLLIQLERVKGAVEVTADAIKETTGLSASDFSTLSHSVDDINTAIENLDINALMAAYREAMKATANASEEVAAQIASQLEASVQAGLQAIRIANAEIAQINATAASGLELSRTEIEKTEARLDELRTMLIRVREEPGKFSPDAYEGLMALIQQTVLELVKLREESQKPFAPPEDVARAWELVNEAVRETTSTQEEAAARAEELSGVLDMVASGLLNLSPEQVEAVRAALLNATDAANSMSGAVLGIQNSIDSLNANTLRTIAMTMARIQGFSKGVADAVGDTTDASARLRQALKEAGGDTAKRNEALRLFSVEAQARRDNLAASEKLLKVNEDIAAQEKENTKSAGGGAKKAKKATDEAGKSAKKAAKDFDTFAKSLTEFETDAEKANRELEELQQALAKYGDQLTPKQMELAKRGMKELAEQAAESATELSELGKILESSFEGFFSDIVDGSKTASEAFNDFLLDMINSITKFLFSQQLQKFLQVLASTSGFGWMGAGGQQSVSTGGSVQGASASAMSLMSTPAPAGGLTRAIVLPQPAIPKATASGGLGGSGRTSINVHNYTKANVTPEVSEDGNGNMRVDLVIRDSVRQLLTSGSLDTQMRTAYGLRRRMT